MTSQLDNITHFIKLDNEVATLKINMGVIKKNKKKTQKPIIRDGNSNRYHKIIISST